MFFIIWLAMTVALASIETLAVKFLLNHIFTNSLLYVAFGSEGVTFWKAFAVVVLYKLVTANFHVKQYEAGVIEKGADIE